MNEVELTVHGIAVGGRGLGRDDNGRVTFVEGALPGERVRVALGRQSRKFAEGRVSEVIDASPDRVDPPCGHAAAANRVGPFCGGCDWQHISAAGQRRFRVAMVEDALRRIGRIDTSAFEIKSADPLPETAYRTGARLAVDGDGRLGFRQPQSHNPLVPNSCAVVHPLVSELMREVRCPGADEVSIRVGARTGERMVHLHGGGQTVGVPDDVEVVVSDGAGHIHEIVDGVTLRISAGAFFQSSPEGAEALIAEVGRCLEGVDRSGVLLDAYSGGGLFSATIGAEWIQAGGEVHAVEVNPVAVADAAVNAPAVASVVSAVEDWSPAPVDAVIADPARSGLEAAGVDRLVATGASVIALVSCDIGALGRDAGLLRNAGYRLMGASVLDLFNQTSHAEVVTRFER